MDTVSETGPSVATNPLSNNMARCANSPIAAMLWLTNSTVRPPRATSFDLAEAFLLELGVADREHLVDDQDLGFEMRGDGKGETHIHAGRVALDRGVEKFLDLGKGDDLVEFPADLGAAHAENRAIEIDILAAGELRVKPGADLQEARDPAAQA